jgi:hypothetical protein
LNLVELPVVFNTKYGEDISNKFNTINVGSSECEPILQLQKPEPESLFHLSSAPGSHRAQTGKWLELRNVSHTASHLVLHHLTECYALILGG